MHESKLSAIVTTIQVTDLDKAIEFYKRFGFIKEWIWPEEAPTHASLSKDGIGFMVVLTSESQVIQKTDLYFRISNVEAFFNHLKDQKLIDTKLIQSAYGMLDFAIMDPWGHHLTFGEPKGDFEQ